MLRDPLLGFAEGAGIENQADVSGGGNQTVCASGVRLGLEKVGGGIAHGSGFPGAAEDQGMRRQRSGIVEEQHLRRSAVTRAGGGGRNGNHARERDARSDAQGDGAAHGMAREKGALRNDGSAVDQFVHERFGAGFSALRGEGAGRSAVARKIGHEDTQILAGEAFGEVPHDALVGGKAVQKDDVALRLAGNGFDHVHAHAAAARAGDDGLGAVRLGEKKENSREEEHSARERKTQFSSGRQAEGRPAGCARRA